MKNEFLDRLFLNYGYDSLIIAAMLYHTIFFHNIEDEDFYNEIEDNVQKVTKGSKQQVRVVEGRLMKTFY